MRGKALLVLAVSAVAGLGLAVTASATGKAVARHEQHSVAFTLAAQGFVSDKFHPRRAGNRVFYATSRRDGRRWLPYISVNTSTLDFRRYGYLAIFYTEPLRGFPSVSEISLDSDGTLTAHVELHARCTGTMLPDGTVLLPSCVVPSGPGPRICNGRQCPPPWGSFLLMQLDKSSLDVGPNRLVVTTAPCPGKQLQPDGSYRLDYC